ncbi:toluene-4-monooxygenase system B family protein [Streptomyces sp. NPDC102462]|uniref:toluene-4-monooxygenase system B family protein n=1 Tax=Streptomyces sp. NPDC102462 TaxID=3366178 RepID=UPI003817DF0E
MFVRAAFDGDVMVRLIPVDDADSLAAVAQAVAQQAVGSTVAPRDRPIGVWHNENLLDQQNTVRAAGIAPMDILRMAYV